MRPSEAVTQVEVHCELW